MTQATTYPIDWVRIEKYCEISGETPSSVKTKRQNGIWPEGIIWRKMPDGVIWYNLPNINKWLNSAMLGQQRGKT